MFRVTLGRVGRHLRCLQVLSTSSFLPSSSYPLLVSQNESLTVNPHRLFSSMVSENANADKRQEYDVQQQSYNFLEVTQQNGLRTIALNDKKTRNALSLQMMQELISAINMGKSDSNLRCIVLTASTGVPIFSSGHNLKQLTSDNGVAAQKNIFATCTELLLSIRDAEVPVIAVVNGLAAAAGCQLVAACDFAIATEKSSFSTPGSKFGLFCSTPGVAVARAANKQTAAFMVLTGQSLSATEALNAGLVAKVVPEEKLGSCVEEMYASIKSQSRSVIHLGKKFFYEQLEMPYEKALQEGEKVMVCNLQLQDCQEGLEGFKSKRHPVWSHTNKTI